MPALFGREQELGTRGVPAVDRELGFQIAAIRLRLYLRRFGFIVLLWERDAPR